MNQRDLLWLTGKALLIWLLLSCLTGYVGEWLLTGLFPVIKAIIIMLAPEFLPSIELIKSTQSQWDTSLQLSAWVVRPVYLNTSHFIPIGTDLQSTVHLLHILVPLVIEVTVLCVWPVQHWLQRLLLLTWGLVSAACVIVLTLPTHLLANLEISFQDIALSGENPRAVPWCVDWMVFCEMGGRWLLALAAAWLCIHVQKSLLPSRNPT
ncbi:hypothetical protein [Methylomonas sp. AM2-LC]|uniref:hypothetical protein n=1 Tax=Methylomonas sp. AM2-LC TaxID=3153301 RepID=UPI0032649C31